MATNLEQLLSSSFPDQAAFIQAATSTRELSAPTSGVPKTKSMVKPQEHRGVVKAKKKNIPVRSGKEKTSRSVNSFMMFRCHYATLFEAFQQKVISTYIVFLWQSDPFKAKWALLAKAYSTIRDQVGKEHAPLDAFLSLVIDFVGIIDPCSYLVTMGWDISVDELGTVSLVKNDTINIDNGMLSTKLSVEDIITFASARGYVAMGMINKAPVSQPSMVMAASAQSPPVKTTGTNVNAQSFTLEQNQDSSNVARLPIAFGPCDMAFDPYYKEMDLVRFMVPNSQDMVTVNLDNSVHTQITPVTPTANAGQIANPSAIDNITDWDPEFGLPIFAPLERNAFDAFDISEWVHPDAYAI